MQDFEVAAQDKVWYPQEKLYCMIREVKQTGRKKAHRSLMILLLHLIYPLAPELFICLSPICLLGLKIYKKRKQRKE